MLLYENTGTANAPAFAPPSTDPFGLADVGSSASPALADLDGDGDLDVFVGNSTGNILFFRNTGTASGPAFAAASTNPFGLVDVGSNATPDFGDIDADGDLDAFVGSGSLLFFQNTGTATAPAFAAASTNPFGLVAIFGGGTSPILADVDGDGDLDIVASNFANTFFFRNSGTVNAPAFAEWSVAPFGGSGFEARTPAFADLDGDGDLDAFLGGSVGGVGVLFFENVEVGSGICADGLDNDGDGQYDAPADPGCASASDTNEKSSAQCDNGLDDDGDGWIDRREDGTGDPQCSSLTDGSEFSPPGAGCGIGPELVLLAPALAALRRRRR
jgi:hypothetical protein